METCLFDVLELPRTGLETFLVEWKHLYKD